MENYAHGGSPPTSQTPLVVLDALAERVRRFHALRLPGEERWRWYREITRLVDDLRADGYTTLTLVTPSSVWTARLEPALTVRDILPDVDVTAP
jgi:hypothetical protein